MNITRAYKVSLASLTCLGLFLGGCANVCDYANCGGASGTGGSGTTGVVGTGSSASTGIAAGCVPTSGEGPKDATCGLFVDPVNGDDANPGTNTSPKKTLGSAAGVWMSGQGIFVCSGALTDTSGVSLPAGVVLYGGLDCANGYKLGASDTRTTLTPAAGEIPLKLLDGASKTEVHSFSLTASAATAKGSSAIGMVVGDVSATFDNVDVTAGDGADGAPGTTPTDNVGSSNPNDASIVGNPGANADTTAPGTKNPGGAAKANPLCTSVGGSGGEGGEIVISPQNGGAGNDGQTAPIPNPLNKGKGGAGDIGDGNGCAAGTDGKLGDAVVDADGAHGATSLGTIAADGFHGVAGAAGPDGKPGQGGGGGGGAKGKIAPSTRGASGGSGGAGGCGGKGATGGGAGGASIAMVLLGSTAPTMNNVTLHAGKGGDGGAGAAGESGGVGGNRGTGGSGSGTPTTAAACDGGKGGAGSNGGSSGAGRGGHSIGIAFVTVAPSGGFTADKKTGGAAGAAAGTGAAADAGVSAETQQLSGS